MKNILIDLIDTQDVYRGSGIYIRKIFLSLLKFVEEKKDYNDVFYICTYDSSKKILYPDLAIDVLDSNPRIKVVDISTTSFPEICEKYRVDTIFLGLGQQLYNYNFDGIKSRTICVLHDIFNLEFRDAKIDLYINLYKTFYQKSKILIGKLLYYLKNLYRLDDITNPYNAHLKFFENNPNYIIITVSQFSFYSIMNCLSIPSEKIQVLWSPEKEQPELKPIENENLKRIIEQKIKYLLLVSADRELKNPEKAIKAYARYIENNPDNNLYLVTIGYKQSKVKGHIVLPYLNDVDIEYAYKNCYALLYPSYFEGFGYPPIEVMKYQKPVLSSYVCSMPEVLGNAPIWFSPFYSTDIYKAITTLMSSDYRELCERSYKRYLEISQRQKEDLYKLIKIILS